jgi:hypothetical protein
LRVSIITFKSPVWFFGAMPGFILKMESFNSADSEKNVEVASVSLVKGYSWELRASFPFFIISKNRIIDECLK